MHSGNFNINPNSWTEILSGILLMALLSVGFFYALILSANIPDVHVSNSTGECVEVINYDKRFDYNCSNYPSKYNHVWVK